MFSLFSKIFRLRQRTAAQSSVAAVTLVAMTSLAAAQDPGPYARIYGGLSSVEGMSFADPATADLDLDGGSGVTYGAAFGYAFGRGQGFGGLRLEADIALSEADLDGTFQENVQVFVPCGEISNSPCLDGTVDGEYEGLSAIAMAYYDFDTGSALTPYIGAGLGLIDVELEATTPGALNDGPTTPFALVDGSSTELATRLAAGVAYDAGSFDVTLGYSWTRSGKADLGGQGAYTTFAFDPRVNVHSFTLGARVNF